MDEQENQHKIENDSTLPAGAIFRLARAQKNLSIEAVADELRLGIKQITALEEDRYTEMPEAMFTRGFIRNYAKLLNISPDNVLGAYNAYVGAKPINAISLNSEDIIFSRNVIIPHRALIYLGIIAVLVAAIWLAKPDVLPLPSLSNFSLPPSLTKAKQAMEQDSDTASSAADSSSNLPPNLIEEQTNNANQESLPAESLPEVALPYAERQTEVTTEPPTAIQLPQAPQTNEAKTANEAKEVKAKIDTSTFAPTTQNQKTVTSVASLPTQASKPETGSVGKLKFIFQEESWLDVYDQSGKQIYSGVKSAGSEQALDGLPPFKVTIGNAPKTQLYYKESLVNLVPHTKDKVARITLE